MINKKGLSAVVTTLIMILLALVAIGMIWLVVTNILEGTIVEIDKLTDCIDAKIEVTAVVLCSGTSPFPCNVSIYNNAGGKSIDGARLTFSNGTDTALGGDFAANVSELTTVTKRVDSGVNNSIKVEAHVYIEDSSGNKQVCPEAASTLTYTASAI